MRADEGEDVMDEKPFFDGKFFFGVHHNHLPIPGEYDSWDLLAIHASAKVAPLLAERDTLKRCLLQMQNAALELTAKLEERDTLLKAAIRFTEEVLCADKLTDVWPMARMCLVRFVVKKAEAEAERSTS